MVRGGWSRRLGRVLSACLPTALALLFARDAPAHGIAQARTALDTPLGAAERAPRRAAWADALPPVDVASVTTGATASLRLYASDGQLDAGARARFELLVSREPEPHALSDRLVQLVFKAAYHFGKAVPGGSAPASAATVRVVSGWRERAGRHTTGEALDFKLRGVTAAQLAAWLRGLPRAGVGVYTHPRTQYVHLDVREPSYHWIDGSPPGVTWKERPMRDPGQMKRDAAWTPEADLPL